jgi:hypothetical protein
VVADRHEVVCEADNAVSVRTVVSVCADNFSVCTDTEDRAFMRVAAPLLISIFFFFCFFLLQLNYVSTT